MSLRVADVLLAVAYLCLLASVSGNIRPPQLTDLEDLIAESLQYQPSQLDPTYDSSSIDDGERPPVGLQDYLNADDGNQDTSMLKSANKRALSILTRWKSLSSVGRRNNALTKSPRAPMSLMLGDMDSKGMPGRRVGAPLRWGRRR